MHFFLSCGILAIGVRVQGISRFQVSGFRCHIKEGVGCQVSENDWHKAWCIGHRARSMELFEFGSGNAECGKTETETKHHLYFKSEIHNPQSEIEGPET